MQVRKVVLLLAVGMAAATLARTVLSLPRSRREGGVVPGVPLRPRWGQEGGVYEVKRRTWCQCSLFSFSAPGGCRWGALQLLCVYRLPPWTCP